MPSLARKLATLVGRSWVRTDPVARRLYSYDAGMAEGRPDLVVLPGTRDELRRVVAACHREGAPVVARGAGTCLSGGPVPVRGGVALVLTRLNRILKVDAGNRVAVVEPGVVNVDLRRAAAPWRLTFAPDPSSYTVSTIGGNAAENAGGPGAVRHGVFRRHVLGLEAVLADGSVVWTGQDVEAPCPDLTRPVLELASLLVGSEGTLAVISRLALQLVPLDDHQATLVAFFATMEEAARAVSGIVGAGLVPSALEMMGRLDIRLAAEHLGLGLPDAAETMLLVEVEGPGPSLERQMRVARNLIEANRGFGVTSATDAETRQRLWSARRAASGFYGKLKPAYLSDDVTVPRHHLPEMFARLAELSRATALPVTMVGHAGDGNLHPAILLDDRRPEEVEEALELNRALIGEAVRLGGSITGEHGVGVEKLPFMELMFSGPTLDYFRACKRAFDPEGILNPGKLLPPDPGETGDAAPTSRRVKLEGTSASGGTSAETVPTAPTPASGGSGCGPDVIARLEGLLGENLLTSDARLEEHGFGGRRRPLAVAVPQSVEALVDTFRVLREARSALWPVGSGGLAATAFRPFQGGVAVSLAGLNRVLDVIPENLTFTVEAGWNQADLDSGTAVPGPAAFPPGLFYAVDCWRGPRSTLGSEIAVNAFGPGRPRYGSTRDQVLGLAFVDPAGRICRVGGSTMKDVSGYDVTRFLCGSWGTMGVVTSATLRLWPRPERELTLAVPCRDPGVLTGFLNGLANEVAVSKLQLLGPSGEDRRWRLLTELSGLREDVTFWESRFVERAERHGLRPVPLTAVEAAGWWDACRLRAGPALSRVRRRQAPVSWVTGYVVVPPTRLPEAAAAVHRLISQAGLAATVNAYCALGLIDFALAADPESGPDVEPPSLSIMRAIEAAAVARVGLYGWSDDLENNLSALHPAAIYSNETARMVARLKREVDPYGLLAPASRLLPL